MKKEKNEGEKTRGKSGKEFGEVARVEGERESRLAWTENAEHTTATMLMGEDRDKRGEWYLFGDRKIVGRENKTGKGRKEGFWRIEDKAWEGTLWNIRARRFRVRMRGRALPKLR